MASSFGATNVVVAVRARPLTPQEEEKSGKTSLQLTLHMDQNNKTTTLVDIATGNKKRFTFDYNYWSIGDPEAPNFASQECIFHEIAQAQLTHSLRGYNACIFAYGQTSSGKTYTMMGPPGSNDHANIAPHHGIIPRMCQDLFNRLKSDDANPANTSFRVEMSFYEVYNEKVYCLLDPATNHMLRPREDPKAGPYVENLTSVKVSHYLQIAELLKIGNKTRHTSRTKMNERSSRSHAVFGLTITRTEWEKDSGDSTEWISRVNLVDLAGSERTYKAGTEGETLVEGININKSLTSLGIVIKKLADLNDPSVAADGSHVPYRDSTLTWLLKDNLGGNSRTVMFATLSPCFYNYDETLTTLRYAERVKLIRNAPTVNKRGSTRRLIRDLRAQLRALNQQLLDAPRTPGGGVGLSQSKLSISAYLGTPATQFAKWLCRGEYQLAKRDLLQQHHLYIDPATRLPDELKLVAEAYTPIPDDAEADGGTTQRSNTSDAAAERAKAFLAGRFSKHPRLPNAVWSGLPRLQRLQETAGEPFLWTLNPGFTVVSSCATYNEFHVDYDALLDQAEADDCLPMQTSFAALDAGTPRGGSVYGRLTGRDREKSVTLRDFEGDRESRASFFPVKESSLARRGSASAMRRSSSAGLGKRTPSFMHPTWASAFKDSNLDGTISGVSPSTVGKDVMHVIAADLDSTTPRTPRARKASVSNDSFLPPRAQQTERRRSVTRRKSRSDPSTKRSPQKIKRKTSSARLKRTRSATDSIARALETAKHKMAEKPPTDPAAAEAPAGDDKPGSLEDSTRLWRMEHSEGEDEETTPPGPALAMLRSGSNDNNNDSGNGTAGAADEPDLNNYSMNSNIKSSVKNRCSSILRCAIAPGSHASPLSGLSNFPESPRRETCDEAAAPPTADPLAPPLSLCEPAVDALADIEAWFEFADSRDAPLPSSLNACPAAAAFHPPFANHPFIHSIALANLSADTPAKPHAVFKSSRGKIVLLPITGETRINGVLVPPVYEPGPSSDRASGDAAAIHLPDVCLIQFGEHPPFVLRNPDGIYRTAVAAAGADARSAIEQRRQAGLPVDLAVSHASSHSASPNGLPPGIAGSWSATADAPGVYDYARWVSPGGEPPRRPSPPRKQQPDDGETTRRQAEAERRREEEEVALQNRREEEEVALRGRRDADARDAERRGIAAARAELDAARNAFAKERQESRAPPEPKRRTPASPSAVRAAIQLASELRSADESTTALLRGLAVDLPEEAVQVLRARDALLSRTKQDLEEAKARLERQAAELAERAAAPPAKRGAPEPAGEREKVLKLVLSESGKWVPHPDNDPGLVAKEWERALRAVKDLANGHPSADGERYVTLRLGSDGEWVVVEEKRASSPGSPAELRERLSLLSQLDATKTRLRQLETHHETVQKELRRIGVADKDKENLLTQLENLQKCVSLGEQQRMELEKALRTLDREQKEERRAFERKLESEEAKLVSEVSTRHRELDILRAQIGDKRHAARQLQDSYNERLSDLERESWEKQKVVKTLQLIESDLQTRVQTLRAEEEKLADRLQRFKQNRDDSMDSTELNTVDGYEFAGGLRLDDQMFRAKNIQLSVHSRTPITLRFTQTALLVFNADQLKNSIHTANISRRTPSPSGRMSGAKSVSSVSEPLKEIAYEIMQSVRRIDNVLVIKSQGFTSDVSILCENRTKRNSIHKVLMLKTKGIILSQIPSLDGTTTAPLSPRYSSGLTEESSSPPPPRAPSSPRVSKRCKSG
eukprot:gene368-525_t